MADEPQTVEEIDAELERLRAEREARARSLRTELGSRGPVTVDTIDQELAALRAERTRRAAQPQAQPARVSQGEDVARSGVTGLQEGTASVFGLGGNLQELNAQLGGVGLYWLRRAQGRSDADARAHVQANLDVAREQRRGAHLQLPTGESVNEAFLNVEPENVREWTAHEPQTMAGEYARTAGQFAPNALIPGSFATRVARIAVPSASSETAASIAREVAPEHEQLARGLGGFSGGILTEAGVAANAGRAARQQPRYAAQELEREFGPMTRGERSGSPQARLQEDDLRRGIGSDQAQATMRTFDARRAQTIRGNAMNVVTRGQPALSENVGEAGVILGDELRTARQAIWQRAQQQYDDAFKLARNEPVPPSDELTARIGDASREHMFEVPPDAARTLNALHQEIRQGSATQAHVERARQELSRRRTQAVNNRQDADEFVYSNLIETLDDWSAGLVRNPKAQRAMQQARGIYREMRQLYGQRGRTDLSTGQTGRIDPGGRAIDRTINTDLTGEQIIDSIVGAGTRPSQQALGAVRRIRELGTNRIIYTNRNAASGVRVPGRQRAGGQTAGQRRFNADDPDAPPTQQNPRGGMEQPTAELQALREGLWHRILRPMDDYLERAEVAGAREGGLLPAQRMVSQLDHALNKAGREVMEQLYTPREMEAMRRLLRYFQTIVPPQGAAVSNTPAGVYRMISSAFDKALGIIPGLGPVLREAVIEAGSTNAARRAVRPQRALRPGRATPPPVIEQPSSLVPPISGMIGVASAREKENERRGRIGTSIDFTRPILNNEDGSFSTEQTITIEADGQFFNIPTIVDGRRVSEDEAVRLWRAGRNPEVGVFQSHDEALRAASARSRMIGRIRTPERVQ